MQEHRVAFVDGVVEVIGGDLYSVVDIMFFMNGDLVDFLVGFDYKDILDESMLYDSVKDTLR